ncbi:MAG: type III pantothenate kinase [Myxococcaceae bacterium]|nr:type III pantothenate kinase [Myxococcaceae bacterium]MBH2006094.1 type III pantothenate kinase [Myxococcaceae bacterium]
MLAVIDIGNTNIVLGIYNDSQLTCSIRFRTERKATADELGYWMSALLERKGIRIQDIEAVCVASVVTELGRCVEDACRTYLGQIPLWVGRQLMVDMPLEVMHPEQLGADRLVNVYAAWKRFQAPLIVVDMGTATTFDVVSPSGSYLGGAIAPGLEIASEALFERASKLNRVLLESPSRAIGKTTVEHLQIGLVLGHAALIDGLVLSMQEEVGTRCRVIATGGLAPFMKQASKTIEIVEPELTLSGLSLLYQEYFRGTRNSFGLDRSECIVGYQEA